MSFPGIIRRLFANNGAGPKLRKDILPSHADTHAPGGSDPLDLETLGGVSSDDFSALQEKVAGLIEAIGNIDPWTIFPPRLPVAIDGVTFGGSDGRRAIMPGETEAREDWILCDGGSDGKGGTVPDLRGRMILGASDEHTAGSTGGSETHSHSISGTVGATTLSVEQMPGHNHTANVGKFHTGGNNRGTYASGDNVVASTSQTGGSQSHTHSLSGVSSEAADSLPPYYAGHYVIRV
nr:MAG TPA: Baseplate structural protein [Caudoviricetes sp.]